MKKQNVIEAYPDNILVLLEKRDRKLRSALPTYINGNAFSLVVEEAKLWQVGVLRVSFKGGTPELHGKIAEVAGRWSQYGGIQFDFGYNKKTGEYREWKADDDSHIRVGFEYQGYWSLVGTDSADPSIVNDGDITLNLSDFDKGLPADWKGTVLHEFGHALGFHHEHQTPDLECDFNWNVIYEELGGPPNNWPKWKVDHNLKQLPGGGLTWSPHDIESIMHYAFPAWMFHSKDNSPCFTEQNDGLSEGDKEMTGRAYPKDRKSAERIISNRIRNLSSIVANKTLDENSMKRFSRQLRFLQKEKI
ncbi:MAG: hypothetical protein GY950_37625 [bacterium]|nr:hypothetical protein [bacterium]